MNLLTGLTGWLNGKKDDAPATKAESKEEVKATTPAPSMEDELVRMMMAQLASYHFSNEDYFSSTKPNKFVLAANGLFRVEETEVGRFIVEAKEAPGLPKLSAGFQFKLPKKIPYNFMQQIIAFFKDAANKKGNVEALVQVFWNRDEESYFLYKPLQIVTPGSVKFEHNTELEQTHLLVADIHSHNTMSAFFSAVDDADEKQTRVYGVVGKINDTTPEIKFRVSVSGTFHPISIWDVFENPFGPVEYPKEWLENLVTGQDIKKLSTLSSQSPSGAHSSTGSSTNPHNVKVLNGGKETPFSTGHGRGSFWGDGVDVERYMGGHSEFGHDFSSDDETPGAKVISGFQGVSGTPSTTGTQKVSTKSPQSSYNDPDEVIVTMDDLLENGFEDLIKEMLKDFTTTGKLYKGFYYKNFAGISEAHTTPEAVELIAEALENGWSETVLACLQNWCLRQDQRRAEAAESLKTKED